MMKKNRTVWSNRLSKGNSKNFQRIGSSINVDKRLYKEDIFASIVHTNMLIKQKIIPKKDGLKNTFYHKIDVRNEESIVNNFKKTNLKFDVIIDDSTHIFEDQIKIIKNCNQFLEKNGILIIEDIYKTRKGYSEANYYDALKSIKNIFNDIIFVETKHINNYSANYKFEKILILIKK